MGDLTEERRGLGGCAGSGRDQRQKDPVRLVHSSRFSPCALLEFRKCHHLQNDTFSGQIVTEDQFLWSSCLNLSWSLHLGQKKNFWGEKEGEFIENRNTANYQDDFLIVRES